MTGDLASAVMYVGGADQAGELLEAYLSEGTLTRAEVERGLTGIGGPHENEKGLEHARRCLLPSP